MKFFDYIRFALKNIWRQKLRSALTIFAIIIGAMSVISMISLVLGASSVFLQQFESAGALTQVTVVSNKDATGEEALRGNNGTTTGILLTDATVEQVKKIEHVVDATATVGVWPLRTFRVKGEAGDKNYSINNVTGYTPGPAGDPTILAGRNLTSADGKGKIVMDSSLATKAGYKDNPEALVGKTLIFTTDKGFTGEGAELEKPSATQNQDDDYWKRQQEKVTLIEAEVVGITNPGLFNDGGGYIVLSWAKGLMSSQRWGITEDEQKAWDVANKAFQAAQQEAQRKGSPTTAQPAKMPEMHLIIDNQIDRYGYNTVTAKVDKGENVEFVAGKVKELGYGAGTAQAILDTVLRTFKILGAVMGAIGAIALLVAAIGVINTMVMATLERTREIGVMRACGATQAAVRRLFTFEAAMLGFWGGVAGVLIGFALSRVANILINAQLDKQHIAATNIVTLPWWLGLAVIGVTTVIGMLAGLYPAYRAARLDPVEALRYE